MAHKKGEGSTQNGRDSISKRLGVKLFGGQEATAGNIIIRQRGTKWHPGENVYLGKDYTIHAAIDGIVTYNKGRRNRTFVNVVPFEQTEITIAPDQPKKEEEKVKVPVAKSVKAADTADQESPAEDTSEEKSATKKAAAKKADSGKDDLKKVEGVGPKIASLLNEAGINTFAELAATDADKIREILEEAGSRYRVHDPATWPQQAGLAAEGKWDELQQLQDELKGGKAE